MSLGTDSGSWESAERSMILCWCAPDATEEQMEQLRVAIKTHLADPAYSIITNIDLSWLWIPFRAILVCPDITTAQLEQLREEVRLAVEDENHLVLVPFDVSFMESPL